MSDGIRKDPKSSLMFGRLTDVSMLRDNSKNPNLRSASVPRRSPRIEKLNAVQDPKTPTLESVRNQGRLSRHRRVVSPVSCGHERVNEEALEVGQKEEVRKSIVSKQLVSSNSEAYAKNSAAEVMTAKVGLRRSPRLINQQKNYEDSDQKLNSVLDEICKKDGACRDQPVKRTRNSNISIGSIEELSKTSEDGSCKSSSKEDEVVNKKRKCGKEGSEVVGGRTKEQQMVLERAYMAMKPTPRFWKKVSKMVGKSSQECFERINYDLHTPVPPQIRSRIKMKTSPPVSGCSLSASKLLASPKPTRKRKTQLGQKKVRELLQKQCIIEKEYERDLFSVLEGNITSPPFKVPQQTAGESTPSAMSLANGSNSFSARKKSVSRLGRAGPLLSPPILKQVKNKALHEKYIDQLHCREAKRKAELTRAKKTTFGKENLAPNVVKAAKVALESDARDVILQFQQVQSKASNNIPSDTEDDDIRLSSDENEDELL